MWGRPWWGTAVNPEAKLLMLAHCFDDCGFGRVKIQTDALNHHSQAAIAKLGGRREGVLRRHTKRADGTFRDSVVFSVVLDDWPAVKAGLEARLAAFPRRGTAARATGSAPRCSRVPLGVDHLADQLELLVGRQAGLADVVGHHELEAGGRHAPRRRSRRGAPTGGACGGRASRSRARRGW